MTLVLSPSEIVSKLEVNGELGLLGKAPNWSRRLLGELIHVQNGAPFASDRFNREGIGMPLIRIRDVGASETSTYFDGDFDPAYVVHAGDLLVGMDGDFRCAKWASGNALLNQRVCRLIVKSKELDERFLFLILPGYLDAIWNETSATTVKHLSSKSIQEIPIPLPSIVEQRKIVEILEDHLSRLEAALGDVKQVKIKAARFRRSLLQTAFTGFLGSHESRSKADPARNWDTNTLKDWGMQAQSGFASGAHNSEGKGVIHLRPMNVSRGGKLDFENYKSVEDSTSRRIAKGDILFNNTNSDELVGKTAIIDVDGDFAYSNHMTRLRFPKDRVNHKYMAILLHSLWMSGYFKEICSNHVNQASVSIKRLEQVIVSLPTIDEQDKILELLDIQLSRLDASISLVEALEYQSNGLRRSMLQSAFTGQLTKEVVCV